MSDDIPALILCGGQGTRLREETEYRPKSMVEVGGHPMLWHIMKIFASQGVTSFVILVGYKGQLIRDYFLNYDARHRNFTVTLGRPGSVDFHGDHDEHDWNVTVVDTGLETMTGARISRAAPFVKAPRFYVTYGDGVADVNLAALMDEHHLGGRLATVTGVRPSARFGELLTTSHSSRALTAQPQMSDGLINGGFFVFERGVFDYLSDDAGCVLEREPLERLAAAGELGVYRHAGFWQCVDTYRDWQALNQLWAAGAPPWRVW
jgi:glucose-1-phosphate cytidylyltransferase